MLRQIEVTDVSLEEFHGSAATPLDHPFGTVPRLIEHPFAAVDGRHPIAGTGKGTSVDASAATKVEQGPRSRCMARDDARDILDLVSIILCAVKKIVVAGISAENGHRRISRTAA